MDNMLLIVNGFDLAHGLPTRYQDFLAFTENPAADIESAYKYWNTVTMLLHSKNFSVPWQFRALEAYHQNPPVFSSNTSGCAPLLQYLKTVSQIQLWVDFETEIQKIVELIITPERKVDKSLLDLDFYLRLDTNESLQYLDLHIQDLLKLMMLYYGAIIPSKGINQYPAWLYQKEFSHLITFNYTDTFRQVIERLNIQTFPKSENCQFIHGTIAPSNAEIGSGPLHNMVLGFTSKNPDDLRTVRFQKYFQRIQKRTGIQYRNWVVHNNPYDSALTIMGHSCDPTDGDALRHLIVNTDETNVYYFDQADYERKITNFIALFGADTFQEFYYSEKIKFIEQPASVPFPPNT